MDHIKGLYEEELELKRQQIEELRQRNLRCDETNNTLINKIRVLEDIIDKANVANKDLNTAFEHIREENLRLQLKSSSAEHQQGHSLALGGPAKEETNAIEQYATLAQESITWISERDQMNRRIKFLERECTRYHRDNTTLGKQVRHLLKSLEQERGMIIRHRSEIPEEDLNQVVTAADVIDKHLVTFECIEELQQNNQKLLTIVKNLGEEQEEREVRFESEEIKRLNGQLQELQSQLDTIKNDRERVLHTLNTIHKERDLFKILLCKTRQVEHMTPEIFQRMVSVACASGPAIADKFEISAERQAHIADLKEIISKLEQELVRVRAEVENLRLQSADEIKLKNELIEKAHAKIIQETKQADVLNQRNGVLEDNVKALTVQFDELRTRCHKLTFEHEEFKKKNEELTATIETAEKARGDLDKILAQEKQLNQQAMIQLSQYKEQNLQLSQALESERLRNQEVVSEAFAQISEIKEKNQEVVSEAFAQISQIKEKNQEEVFQALKSASEFQELRNLERARRMRLAKRTFRRHFTSNKYKSAPTKTRQRKKKIPSAPQIVNQEEIIQEDIMQEDIMREEIMREEIIHEDQIPAETANSAEEEQPQQESQPPQVIKFKRRNFS